jgi:hypothetical protein
MLLPAGASSHSARIAATTIVKGLTFANASSHSGIDSTGTNADDANVSGKIAMKPIDCAASATRR